MEEARARGLILLTCGLYGNGIRILVPVNAGAKVLDEGLDILEASLRAVRASASHFRVPGRAGKHARLKIGVERRRHEPREMPARRRDRHAPPRARHIAFGDERIEPREIGVERVAARAMPRGDGVEIGGEIAHQPLDHVAPQPVVGGV